MKIEHLNTSQLKEISLLFLSRNIPYSTETANPGYHLILPDAYAEQALEEIELYYKENSYKKLRVMKRKVLLKYPYSTINLLIVGFLAGFHNYLGNKINIQSWFDAGHFSAESILDGEIYRTITALTLHLDNAHLFSNLVGLLLFTGFIQMLRGSGVAWSLTIGSGILGNFFNAWFYQTAHYAVGASTAVFGALGALAMLGGRNNLSPKKQLFVAVVAAVGILAMLGVSPKTDVMAHIFGFFAGLILGIPFRLFKSRLNFGNGYIQWTLLTGDALLIFFAWNRALT